MRDDLTDITLVVDRSGSMQQVKNDAEGGINAFIAAQAKEPGEALLTLVQFDNEYEFVHQGVPIAEVPPYQLEPRGMTALLDALGRSITETGKRLAAMPEPDRPGLVIVVVMTDGLENSSREFTKPMLKEMIEQQQTVYNWQFTFLAANQDAFHEAGAMGIDPSGVANFSAEKQSSAFRAVGNKVARMRSSKLAHLSVENNFTSEERAEME